MTERRSSGSRDGETDYGSADEVIAAIVKKLEANKPELDKARFGHIKFRKDNGRISVELTPTL